MYIGVDLGGTNIAVGLVTNEGQILSQSSRPTLSKRHYSEIVKDIAELCAEVTHMADKNISDIKAIGIGSPGSIDNANGIVIYANNLNWHNLPLADELRRYIDVPIKIENDANAAAYGEYVMNGDNKDSFVAITLGTGVGGGIIIDKKIYRGFNGAGGELGHIALKHNGALCSCGNKGCWEAYASATALIEQTKRAIAENPGTLMAKDEKINGKTAFVAAKAGDTAAQKVVDQYIEYVAGGIVSIVNIFQPDVLVIGGGISKEGDYLLNPIKEYVKIHNYAKTLPQTELKIATLMNDAGIVGAALAAM